MQGVARGVISTAVAAALLALPAGAGAATIHVEYKGDEISSTIHECSLREAVRSANLNTAIADGCENGDAGLDKIKVPAKVYELTIPGPGDTGGDLDISEDVKISGTGGKFTVDAGGEDGIDDRILDIAVGADAKVSKAVLRNGLAVDSDGGAVQVSDDSSFKLTNGVMKGNRTSQPGSTGGAVYAEGDLTLVNVKVLGSESLNVGAIRFASPDAEALLRRVTVEGSRAPFAGGAVSIGGDGRIVESTISGNRLEPGSTGTHSGGGVNAIGDVTIRNSTISGNLSEQNGGGIAVNQGIVRLIHSTVTANRADSDSGAMFDSPGQGGGVWVDTDAALEIRGSIVADNFDDSILAPLHRDCSGEIDSWGYNLVRFQLGCTINAVNDPGTDLAAGTNPKLKPLASNGGPTQTHALKGSSPLVNLVPKALCAEVLGLDPLQKLKRDQRGVRRPQGNRCDAGSYERN